MSSSGIEIEKLSTEDRLHLIEALWESLRSQAEAVPLTGAQRKELDHRLDEIDRGDTETIPWDDVRRRLRSESE